ncbi:glycosyltransferase [Roseitranquillus sediminis]|uniref:glycosyltransferase n=1 Tax=Roseitranquillus sediminis TaxID=2809051 RepID=UPI001D0CD5F3|nr:glycosyltransferase [Roseitranquillus sediminis]MBM9594008.1 glycosyltransferase [Roseitranquillus sediminis]
MRVAVFPDWRRDNPYQRLLAEALAPLGVEMVFPAGYRRGLPLSRAVLPQPRPDLLHLHWPSAYLRSRHPAARAAYCMRTLMDLSLVRRAGIPVVWTVHNLVSHDTPTPRLERWFSARLAALADGLIVHSEAARAEVTGQLGAAEEKVTVIPHGSFRPAYGELPSRAEARAALGIEVERPLVLFFGMIRPYKGVPNLLRAWSGLKGRRGDALLLVVGLAQDPKHSAEIEALAAQTDNIRLDLRFVEDAEVPVLMAATDLLVLPFGQSLTSGTVRLARDYNVPVVVPRVPSATDAVGAILAENTGPEALGDSILRGLQPVRWANAPAHVSDDWLGIAEQHASTFSKIFAAPTRCATNRCTRI